MQHAMRVKKIAKSGSKSHDKEMWGSNPVEDLFMVGVSVVHKVAYALSVVF